MRRRDPGKMHWWDWVIGALFLFICALAWTDLSTWVESWVR